MSLSDRMLSLDATGAWVVTFIGAWERVSDELSESLFGILSFVDHHVERLCELPGLAHGARAARRARPACTGWARSLH